MPAAAEAEAEAAFPEQLTTERLTLRRFRPDDAEWYAGVNAEPEVTRYLSGGEPFTRAQSDESLRSIVGHWDERRFGLWAAERLDTGEPIGFVGLAVPTFVPELLPAVEVGWRMSHRQWGNGFATEGARVALEHGFGALDLDRIVSITVHDNSRSRHVMERLGLTWDRACINPRFGMIVEVRSISRDTWSASR